MLYTERGHKKCHKKYSKGLTKKVTQKEFENTLPSTLYLFRNSLFKDTIDCTERSEAFVRGPTDPEK